MCSWSFNMGTMAKRKKLYDRMTEVIATVTNPKLKNSFIKARDEYWERIGQLNKPSYTKEDYEQIQQEHYRIENLVHKIKVLNKGNPVKHILYCKSLRRAFKEEIDVSQVGISYEDDYLAYRKKLNFYIDKALAKHDLEKHLCINYYSELPVKPEGSFIYSDAIQKMIKKRLNDYKIDLYLDTVTKNGKVIETEKIDIIDFFKRNPEYFQQPYINKATNEYISMSLKRFVKESCWQIRFENNTHYIIGLENPNNWPSLKDDGTWTSEEMVFRPRLWFGLKNEEPNSFWNLNGSDMKFWFDEDNDKYFIGRHSNWDVGRYRGYLPDMKAIRKSCPIQIEEFDTPESVKEKIQKFFIKQYRKAHPKKEEVK